MEKLAKSFFEKGYITIKNVDVFYKSDLFLYLKLLYKKEPIVSETGFIKVTKKDDSICLSEHIYHDLFPEDVALFYLTIPEIQISSSSIKNNRIGKNLHENGFALVDASKELIKSCLDIYPQLNYKEEAGNTQNEPFATFKIHSEIWSGDVLPHISKRDIELKARMEKEFRKIVEHSEILNSLNIFDVNFLEWTQDRDMDAHNGLDYRSFLNIITYNTNSTESTRALECGHYNWYDLTFECLFQNDFEKLMTIDNNLEKLETIEVKTNKIILVNSFNPKFYHKVYPLKSNTKIYTSTANFSFREITDDIKFIW